MSKIKITLIVLLSFLALTASARRQMRRSYFDGMLRKGLHVGAQGSFNSTWILQQNNYNTLNLFYLAIVRQSEMDYVFTWGGQVGGEIGYNFIKRFGIEFDPSFSWAGQSYDDNFTGPVAVMANGQTGNITVNGTSYTNVNLPDPQYAVIKNGVTTYPYWSGNYNYVNVRREVKFTYLQFPIYAKYQTHIGDIANYYLMVGPQVNYRESASESVWVNYYPYANPNNFTPDQKFKKLDYGVSLNTGVDIYATDWMYFNLGLVSFIAINDLNGDALKNLGWYDKNHVSYQQSRNFYMGFHAGIHFYLDRRQN
jgi:hypothetical protein